jgi:NAD(P)-dependent dehydrogenase (short-subunit alcohol dehydrogenase family)
VALLARREKLLQEVAEAVAAAGGTPLVVPGDITDRAQFEHAVDVTVATFGRLDLLVNNAGHGAFDYVEKTTTEQLRWIFETNVFPLWYGTGRALHHMRKQGNGTILTISSLAGRIGYPANAHYVAAKHAAIGFTMALRAELADSDVTATVAVPGGILTDWATVTRGGAMLPLFEHEQRRGAELAAEMRLPPLPHVPILTADIVARKIADALEDPPAEIFTHDGSRELVRLFEENRLEFERRMTPYWLANLEYGREREML